ncbi:alpha-ketoglutarate-dependent dioxygenase AlkB family protein [Streptomyces beihaiensis]|uniref:Alpha-ketoglutarate-dependent dioxygenase AlkB n=1 Tax=Streptomyces beihaiensis TaxID=2984495 RepID=A0ABT3TYW2_9ACTN|nr:alpha-ketoglutarate-dependent dioxygenase AlkB [Streptomyces beihaiensis]MCX3062237.1 alpha-ketoglutarate-dependent dioxygenase AlkB [Streptomyces beihaiensis]
MGDTLFPRERREIAPGAVHLPDWLAPDEQRELVEACRAWARPPAGLRTVRTPGGGTMSARQFGLGWHWSPRGYARVAADGDGQPVKPMPGHLAGLARRAVSDAYGETPDPSAYRRARARDRDFARARARARARDYDYDIALVNFYDAHARMGMHQDKDERCDAPVVSLSLGDSCVFRFGNPHTRTKPYTDVELRSGDLFVFGGPSRLAFHGVPRVLGGTGPAELGLVGRLNVTLRASGFE